jgi:glucose/mannose-6-phosphate isomerase
MRVLEAAGAVESAPAVRTETADVVDRLVGDADGAGYTLGVDIGEALLERLPVAIGPGGPAALAARRWMTQINENAKRPAFFAEIPELNHNALEAWATRGVDDTRIGVVALSDPAGSPRNERRLDLTMRRLGGNIASAGTVTSRGDSPFTRFWSLAAVGDVASVAMAERTGVDPEPVDVLEGFKKALREE